MVYEFDPKFGGIWAKNSCALDSLFLLRALGADYDGMDGSIEGMRGLVDELVELAGEAIDFIRKGKIELDEEEEYQSQQLAYAQAREYMANQEEE